MEGRGSRSVLPGMTFLLWLAVGLVLIASVQLFVLTERTDRFFAWTIAAPLSAAASGAFYLSAAVLLLATARARAWRSVWPVAAGVFTISTVKLAATLLHRHLFHFAAGPLTARIAAWGWLIIYAIIPVALIVLAAAQARAPARDVAAPSEPLPTAFRAVTTATALVLVAIAVGLFFAPGTMVAHWPWPLTPLTARDLAAWFGGIGVVGGLSAVLGEARRSRPVWAASVVLAVLQGVALLRYGDTVRWGAWEAWAYVAVFVAVGAAGVWGTLVPHRAGTPPSPVLDRPSASV